MIRATRRWLHRVLFPEYHTQYTNVFRRQARQLRRVIAERDQATAMIRDMHARLGKELP